jgi:rfaE bifunctional protein nucleotidyltransferase chain/domain
MIPVASPELYASPKVLSLAACAERIAQLKDAGKRVGLCSGGFDLLHPGHLRHFESAKGLCDALVVAVTSDRFVSSRKGSGRPIYPEGLRAYFAAGLACVDLIVISDIKGSADLIRVLKPSFYVKGVEYKSKTTPGITAERDAIASVGGEMRYTEDPPMSTTAVIDYIKQEVDRGETLLILDRDGTLIADKEFLGKDAHWREQVELNKPLIDVLSAIQTRTPCVKLVITNQTGVARGLFPTERVDEVNAYLGLALKERSISIDAWQYCPNADAAYAQKHPEIPFRPEFVKQQTKRKPSAAMVTDALEKLGRCLSDFSAVIVFGDREEDKGLAQNLNAKYIDVKGKTYEELLRESTD